MLTQDEIELVATLKTSAAFKLLLESIEAEIDTLAYKLENCVSKYEETFILSLWRASRKIYSILRSTPEHFDSLVREMEKSEVDEIQKVNIANYQAMLDWSDRLQKTHLEILNSENEEEQEG